jgi:hypothetical protein
MNGTINYGGSSAITGNEIQNVFSDDNRGPAGSINRAIQHYSFLKSNPYYETLAGGHTYDRHSLPYVYSKDQQLVNNIEAVRKRVDMNRRQVRYNSFSNTGTSVPKKHTYEYMTDYHRLVKPFVSRNMLVLLGGLFVVYIVTR